MQPLLPLRTAEPCEALRAIVNNLAESGFHIEKNAINAQLVADLLQFAQNKRNTGAFKKAGIGKMQQHQIDETIRGDRIMWVEADQIKQLLNPISVFLDELKQCLNRHLYLGLRDYEMHLAVYPAGTFYKRHADRFSQQAHRYVSFVFYLNPNWQKGDGGELVIYLPNGTKATIEPKGGTLAIFLSELEHEVLPATAARYSLTGWMLDVELGLTFL